MTIFNRIFLLLSLVLLLGGQKCQKKTASFQELPQSLFQTWFHSYEEDLDSVTVYRPEGYALPLSRGRTGFAFKKDGHFEQYDIAPTDGLEKSEGKWARLTTDELEIRLDNVRQGRPSTYRIYILTLQENKMVVRIGY